MNFFLFPMLYTFKTRLNNKKKLLAWLLSYLVPTCYVVYCFSGVSFNLELLIGGVLALTSIYNVYEIGYIYNDAELTKKEVNPTIRLSDKEISFYEVNKFAIYIARATQCVLTCLVLSFFSKYLSISTAIACAMILILYLFYNSIRNLINIPLYSFLVWFRYFGICLVFYNAVDAFLLWVIYPLCVTIEFASKPRFGKLLRWVYGHIDLFRVFYYISLLLISISILTYLGVIHDYSWFVFLIAYYSVFRFLSYIFLSKRYRAQ